MDTQRKVPELSLLSYVNGSESDKVKFVDQLFTGIKDYGFITLVDHVVEQKTIDDAYSAMHEFFQLSEKEKLSYVCKAGGGQRGYTAFGTEHAKDNPIPDLKEFWHVGREIASTHKYGALYPENLWPVEVTGFQEKLYKLYSGLDSCANYMLEALGRALDVPSDFFANMIKDGNSILRPIHYPPISEDMDAAAIRAAAHEDINLITLLIGATSSGLQLLDRDGTWLDIETSPGQIVVDSGDMMQRLTNDVVPATTHRVINPDNSKERRYSMPFFVHPNPDAVLECIPSCLGDGAKYPPINANDWLMQRIRDIGLMG
jgi:isopenicillin N synthase-like dioxygenase